VFFVVEITEMSQITVEQAIYGNLDAGGYRFLARSPGFRDDWLAEAQRICTGFGDRPAGVACPACVFAQPLGKQHVAIVQVADQGSDDAGRPGALGFHLLLLPRAAYRGFGGDPFALAERCPPPWPARGELPALSWPAVSPPGRTVEQVRGVLKRPDGPNLLGGAQVLADGGRLVFERAGPDPDLLHAQWMLLPTSTRTELWPASFAFGNSLRFHVLAVPRVQGDDYPHYVTESQAADYPEGRYELALQTAAEAGDQKALDKLLARRSGTETMRLALYILGAAVVVLVAAGLLNPKPPPAIKTDSTDKERPAPKQTPAQAELKLPREFPTLSKDERQQLKQALVKLAAHAEALPPENLTRELAVLATTGSLASTALLAKETIYCLMSTEALLEAIDRRLGTDPKRDPGPLRDIGSPQRQLRALLWKHGVADYHDLGLTTSELVERLQRVVDEMLRARALAGH
jgi:hypothetical protein